MKSDVVVVGGELDGLVAATRLLELGHSVRVLATGRGSLHYAPGGIHVLGYAPVPDESGGGTRVLPSPCTGIPDLPVQHPYRIAGESAVRDSLDWFFRTTEGFKAGFERNNHNVQALTPAGLSIPTYAPTESQAVLDSVRDRHVALVRFPSHRDFPAHLTANGLRRTTSGVTIVEASSPGVGTESIDLARSFDRHPNPYAYFRDLDARLPACADVALFPAVLGFSEHARVVQAAEQELGRPCLEVPTVPPSVSGMRLQRTMDRIIAGYNAPVHIGARVSTIRGGGKAPVAVVDGTGSRYCADTVIVATGGVAMGGLEVDSRGTVRETVFDLPVRQTAPLNRPTPGDSLNALHSTGVETDHALRPVGSRSTRYENFYVTGRTLAHWNPAVEASAEGVAIVTGWLAARSVHSYLQG